jgi:hypothetical protein
MASDRGSGARAWMTGTSGAFTWQVMQKSRAWQVAQLCDTATGVPSPACVGLASSPCRSMNSGSR